MRTRDALAVLASLGLIALVYWPVHHGGFVWDDKLCFHDAGWLHGGNWSQYMFRGFCDWTDYFRPLVVALYALQVQGFGGDPGAMHLVSLGLHLVNTLLVGVLARRLCPHPAFLSAAVMLLYGLHPALVEPVFWIGCQYEMVVVLGALLALLSNMTIENSLSRACTVAVAFFLAACAKESAVAIPLLLIVFDLSTQSAGTGLRATALATLRRQWPVYAMLFGAGLAYLALRHWAIGAISSSLGGEPLISLARAQKAALTYLSYWKLLVWPMTGLSPIHPVDDARFAALSGQSLAIDASAIAIALGGLLAFRRRAALGSLIMAVSAALLPVLHLVPIQFNESLYHERYAMLALAVGCAWLPAAVAPLQRRLLRNVTAAIGLVWLILAVINIRVTLPLWSDELALWQWALREHPDSLVAKQHLLAKYSERGDRMHARALADTLIAENAPCPVCMLSIAYLALDEGDAARASLAIDRIRNASTVPGDPLFMEEFIIAQGELLELQNDPKNAATAYRDAMAIDPVDPRPRMNLAMLLLRLGDLAQARANMESALALYAPVERAQRRKIFEDAAAAATASP